MYYLRHLGIVVLLGTFTTCTGQAQIWNKVKDKAKEETGISSGGLTEAEVADGLKEALAQGARKGTETVSEVDGYFKNPNIKIPFPPEAKQVEAKVRDIGMDKQADEFILSMNRAAEDAATEAKPILVDAIKQLTVRDAMDILHGDADAATQYLERTTTGKLTRKFRPVIEASLEKVNATKYWSDIITAYNRLPMVEKQNPDLAAYVTEKALDGLFFMIAKEEKAIREDPVNRTTDLLKKVFAEQDG